jgi:aminoglycoside phosphotransferase (APT) family kinase protein
VCWRFFRQKESGRGKIMLNYTDEQIRIELVTILATEAFIIKPVGNHDLKRHLVYQIDMNNGERYIFKLYYKDRRRCREIASLRLLEGSEVKCPRIFKYGDLQDGKQWLITHYIEGELLEKLMDTMTLDNRLSIFEEMGEDLGILHTVKTFDFFGEWDESGNSIHNIKSYYENFVKSTEKSIDEVLKQDLPEQKLLKESIEIIRNNYERLNIDVEAKLVHNDFDGRNLLIRKENGVYRLSGVIDFEGCYPNNPEENLVQLYYRYFLDNKDYEKAFFKGYNRYINLDSGFHERLHIYLLCFPVVNCSWSYIQAPDYYKDNIRFLENILK